MTLEYSNPILEQWIAAGQVTMPTRPRTALPVSPVSLPDGTARRLIDEERDETY